MSLYNIGRICVKIAGRDAGKKCAIVEKIDNNFVLVDGSTRRKKVNIRHLEPLKTVLEIKKGASHEEIKTEFEKLGLKVWDKKSKEVKEKPKKEHTKKVKPVKEKKKPVKKKVEQVEKKEEPKVEEAVQSEEITQPEENEVVKE
jgi:large subunit ribosomal protein L14e